jgi:hypothetical protein
MKRIIKIICASLFALLVPLILVSGQNKKSEQKIKVIVDNGSGTKVIIDTVYKDTPAPDSINLNNGTVVYIKHHGEVRDSEHQGGKEHLTVTYSSNSTSNSREDFDNDSTVEKTRFVIAKDGMVVTIEGNDEAKAKELAKEIESKLGVNTKGSDKKETVKVESKKEIKK